MMRLAVLFAAALLLVGCGNGDNSDTSDSGDSGVAETSSDDSALDASMTYPADHTAFPQVDYNGGRVLANPKIVTVTFAGDDGALVGRLQQFDDQVTTLNWWTAVSSEYCDSTKTCIGKGSGGGHVVVTDPPASSYDDTSQPGNPSSLQDWIKLHVSGPAVTDAGTDSGADGGSALPDFPKPDPNTLYVIYFPPGVTINLDGQPSCSTFGAYHNTTILPQQNGIPIFSPYAVIPRCANDEQTNTLSSSHEIIEAATDPDIGQGAISFYMRNQLWGPAGGEVGDLCEFGGKGVAWVEATFTMQRTWSNKSAAAGNDPCVPIPTTEVYFNAAARQSKIVLPHIGSTATVDIDAFSVAPYPPWTLAAFDFNSFQGGGPVLSFSFSSTSVQNGDYIQLTVTATGALPNGQDEFVLVSKDPAGTRHTWPVLAATN